MPRDLAARHELGRARVVVRQGDVLGVVPPLERAVESARAAGDAETEAISLAMLGAMRAYAGQLEESARRFDEAITLCEATGDTLQLGVTLNNRMALRVQQRDAAGARADLERAVALGRELGNDHPGLLNPRHEGSQFPSTWLRGPHRALWLWDLPKLKASDRP